MRRRAATGVAACGFVVAALVGTACGGSDDAAVRPALDQIAPAIAAVDAELGGPQQYFEVNATPQLVNLFVSSTNAIGATIMTPYVYVGDELAPAGESTPADGATFVATAATFDADTVLDQVGEELPDSDIPLFTIVGGPGGAVQFSADVQSERGGTMTVVIGPDGAVQSVDPN